MIYNDEESLFFASFLELKPHVRESGIREIFVRGIRNPGLWKLEYSSKNPEFNDWNPESNDWNPEFNDWNPESNDWNPEFND